MGSGDSYHSESEFYYPDEFEDGKNKDNPVSQLEKQQDFSLADAQDFILGQRTENTVKKKTVRPKRLAKIFPKYWRRKRN